jgi:hypothetical protein
MDKSQKFNTLEVNTLKTNKLDYSYSNNIIYITTLNSKSIILNSSYSNYYIVTKDNSMNIEITLSSVIVGTKFRILITNTQNTLKIKCNNIYDIFNGSININNNSSSVNQEELINNLQKKYTVSSDNNKMLYIPNTKLGLYNGGYIDLIYLGNKYCNKSNSINQISGINENAYWYVSGELIGLTNLPKNIISNSIIYILTIYLNLDNSKIICVTTENPNTNMIYFNKIINNDIWIFLDLHYKIKIVDVVSNTIIYDTDTYNSIEQNFIYNLKICNNLLNNVGISSNLNYIDLQNKNTSANRNTLNFINGFISNSNYNIKETFNNNNINYDKLNIIKYKITNTTNDILNGYFNVISIKSYNNNSSIINTLPSLLFGNYNIFTDISNNIILDNTKY